MATPCKSLVRSSWFIIQVSLTDMINYSISEDRTVSLSAEVGALMLARGTTSIFLDERLPSPLLGNVSCGAGTTVVEAMLA